VSQKLLGIHVYELKGHIKELFCGICKTINKLREILISQGCDSLV